MSILHFSDRVLIHFTLKFSNFFWVAQTIVHHALIVRNQTHFALELRVEVVLTPGESVTFFLHSCTVALLFVSESIVYHIILSQGVVESAFSVSRVIHEAQAARVVGDVGVAATSVVHIHDGFGMDVGEGFSWPLVCCYERSYKRYQN